jgi:hypothetical protein
VPSNREDGNNANLVGQRILGRQVLEVPVQISGAIDQRILDAAFAKNITIRDVNGKVY